MTPRTPVLAGNWKMHLGPAQAREFVAAFLREHSPRQDRTVILFPPAISLVTAREALAGRDDVQLGVQHIHWEEKGAFTGEISAAMAADAGAGYALVGHSERRQLFGETTEDTRRKVAAAIAAGLTPVLCVGETLEQRRAGRAEDVVASQLRPVLQDLAGGDTPGILIAYEPVWAIGTGETASPADAGAMHRAIQQLVAEQAGDGAAVPVLYGGSVKPDNAPAILAEPGVDGVLVGGASLDPAGFAAICRASA